MYTTRPSQCTSCMYVRTCTHTIRTRSSSWNTAVTNKQNQVGHYHAEMPNQEREKTHRLWSQGKIPCICATVAFGMGCVVVVVVVVDDGGGCVCGGGALCVC
jgi:superfamily II DNA helicase RecQ